MLRVRATTRTRPPRRGRGCHRWVRARSRGTDTWKSSCRGRIVRVGVVAPRRASLLKGVEDAADGRVEGGSHARHRANRHPPAQGEKNGRHLGLSRAAAPRDALPLGYQTTRQGSHPLALRCGQPQLEQLGPVQGILARVRIAAHMAPMWTIGPSRPRGMLVLVITVMPTTLARRAMRTHSVIRMCTHSSHSTYSYGIVLEPLWPRACVPRACRRACMCLRVGAY